MTTTELLNLWIPYYCKLEHRMPDSTVTIKRYFEISAKNFKEDVLFARELGIIEDKTKEQQEEYRKRKKELPVTMITCTTSSSKDIRNITETRPVFCIDVDDLSPDSIPDVKRELFDLPYIFLVSLSVSGRGVFALGYSPMTKTNMKGMMDAVEEDLASMGITMDGKCKNPNRMRFMSYDEDILIKGPDEEITPYMKMKEAPTPVVKEVSKTVTSVVSAGLSAGNDLSTHLNFVSKCIRLLVDKCGYRCDTGAEWHRDAYRIGGVFGDAGFDLFHYISQHSNKYVSEEECRRIYDYCKNNSYGTNQIPHYFRKVKDAVGSGWIRTVWNYPVR